MPSIDELLRELPAPVDEGSIFDKMLWDGFSAPAAAAATAAETALPHQTIGGINLLTQILADQTFNQIGVGPPRTLDLARELRLQTGVDIDADIATTEKINDRVRADIVRFGWRYPMLKLDVAEVPMYSTPLHRWYASARLLRAAREEDVAHKIEVPVSVRDGLLIPAALTRTFRSAAYGLLGRYQPGVLLAAMQWLGARDSAPESIRPVVQAIENTPEVLNDIFADSDVAPAQAAPIVVSQLFQERRREFMRSLEAGIKNSRYVLLLQKAGLADLHALARLGHSILHLDDVPDPATVAQHLSFVRQMGEAALPQLEHLPPEERLYVIREHITKIAETLPNDIPDRTVRNLVSQTLGTVMRPLAGVLSFLLSEVPRRNLAILLGPALGKYDPEQIQIWSEREILKAKALFAKLLGDKRTFDEVVRLLQREPTREMTDLALELAGWEKLWDEAVDRAGVRQWLQARFSGIGVAVFDAIDVSVGPSALVAMLPDSHAEAAATVFTLGLAPAAKAGLPNLATRYEWAMRALVKSANKPAVARALTEVRRSLNSLDDTAKRSVANRLLEAGRKLNSLDKTPTQRALQKFLNASAACADATPDGWRNVFDAIGALDPNAVVRAADPFGQIVMRLSKKALRALPRELVTEQVSKAATAMAAAARGAVNPFAPGTAIAETAFYTAVEGQRVTSLFDVAIRYQRKVVRGASEAVKALELERLHHLVHGARVLKETLADPIAACKGFRPPKALIEVLSTPEVAEVISQFNSEFRVAYEAASARAKKIIARMVRPKERELLRAMSEVQDVGSRLAALRGTLDEIRRARETLKAIVAPERAQTLVRRAVGVERARTALGKAAERIGRATEALDLDARYHALLDSAAERVTRAAENVQRKAAAGAPERVIAKAERTLARATEAAQRLRKRLDDLFEKRAGKLYASADAYARAKERLAAIVQQEGITEEQVRESLRAGREIARTAPRLERLVATEAKLAERLRVAQRTEQRMTEILRVTQAMAEEAARTDPRLLRAIGKGLARALTIPEAPAGIRRMMEALAAGGQRLAAAAPVYAAQQPVRRFIRNLFDNTISYLSANEVRMRRLLRELDQLKKIPEALRVLERVLGERGVDPATLAERVTRAIEDVAPGLWKEEGRLRAWIRDFADFDVELLRRLRDSGRISERNYRELLKFHKPVVMRYEALPEALRGAPEVVGALEGDHGLLSVQHVPTGWGPQLRAGPTSDYRLLYRVGPTTYSRYFQSEEAARAFVKKRGIAAADYDLLAPAEDVARFAEPNAIKARLKSLHRLIKLDTANAMQNAAVEMGLAVEPIRGRAMPPGLISGPAAEWIKLPDSRALGVLANKYVHRSFLMTAAKLGRFNSTLGGFVAGVAQEMQIHAGGSLSALAGRLLRLSGIRTASTAEAALELAKSVQLASWIAINPITYLGNVSFNLLGATIGLMRSPTVFFSKGFWEGVKKWLRADPDIENFARNGLRVSAGGVVKSRRPIGYWLDKIFGDQGLKGVAKRIDELEAMDVSKMSARAAMRRAEALETLHHQLGRGLAQRLVIAGRETASTALKGLFSLYSAIDEAMRCGLTNALVAEGMPVALAVADVNTFIQDYSRINPTIKELSGKWWGTFVPSFPAEWGRLMKNYLTRRPIASALAASGMIGNNIVSLAHDGITWEEWMQQIGEPNPVLAGLRAMSMLRFPGGTCIDLGAFTGANMLYIPVGISRFIARELSRGDSVLEGVLSALLSVAGRFVLNNPLVAGIGVVATGRDQFTGRRLVDEGASVWEKVRAAGMWALRTSLPPWTPGLGGYQAEKLSQEWDYRNQEPISLLRRIGAIAGVRRYTGKDAVANLIAQAKRLGMKTGVFELPLYGSKKELYDAFSSWSAQVAADPENEALARQAFEDLRARIEAEDTIEIRDEKIGAVKDEAAVLRALVSLARDGPAGQFVGLTPVQQAFVLGEMLCSRIDSSQPELFRQLTNIFLDGPAAYQSTNPLSRRIMVYTGALYDENRNGGLARRSLANLQATEKVLTLYARRVRHPALQLLLGEVRVAIVNAIAREEKKRK